MSMAIQIVGMALAQTDDMNQICTDMDGLSGDGTELPSTDDRQELCKCKPVIDAFKTVKVLHCYIILGINAYTYKAYTEYSFGLCDGSMSPTTTIKPLLTITSSTTSPPTTTSPTPTRATLSPSVEETEAPKSVEPIRSTPTTTTPFLYRPVSSTSSDSESSGIRSGMVTWIVGGIVVVVVAIGGLVVWKRRRTHRLQADEPQVVVVAVPVEAELSPLCDASDDRILASMAAYTSAPLTASAPDAKHMV